MQVVMRRQGELAGVGDSKSLKLRDLLAASEKTAELAASLGIPSRADSVSALVLPMPLRLRPSSRPMWESA